VNKLMVRCDIEGASGVVSYEQAEPGKVEYAFGRAMLLSDLAALVEGLNAGGADAIWIYDEHYDGRNVDLAALPPNVSVICGKPPYRPEWAGGLDPSFDGLILLGYHSKAGAPGGLLPHTYELDIRELRLNGVSIGEIGMEAAVGGDHGVPTAMVTGDSAAVAEAEALLPGVVGVVVKEALSPTGARCHPTSVTAPRIRSAAAELVRNPPEVEPYRVGEHATLEVALSQGPYREAVRALFPDAVASEDVLVLNGATATEVWARYWEMKLAAQARVAAREEG
jgi:D-amino peptidase